MKINLKEILSRPLNFNDNSDWVAAKEEWILLKKNESNKETIADKATKIFMDHKLTEGEVYAITSNY